MSLASRLPYDHPYAGGYPGIGSQPLPTDADALDYLARVKAADGAGVEVGVATAVDAFFRDLKATGQEYDGVYRTTFESLKACCILAGARTLAGALVPVVGDAPTNVANGFVSGDYSRTAGLTGDGTSYLDSGRANEGDPQNDHHYSVYATSANTLSVGAYIGRGPGDIGSSNIGSNITSSLLFSRSRCATQESTAGEQSATGLIAISRSGSTGYTLRVSQADIAVARSSDGLLTGNSYVFARNAYDTANAITNATLAFYSIGTSLDLEALDTAVDNLITAIGEAL